MLIMTALWMLRQGNDSDLLGYVVSEVNVRPSLSNQKKETKDKNLSDWVGSLLTLRTFWFFETGSQQPRLALNLGVILLPQSLKYWEV